MNTLFESGLVWWITAFDLPVISGMFWMIWRTRKECNDSLFHLHEALELRSNQLREALSAFKLEVAKSYASVGDMKDLEFRIVGHLLRIESKLDRTALKAASLQAEKTNNT
ncbi:MAG: hypothetical protein H6853_04850 [Rhodospirillales bacterium]|nr:hypothetical protein [Alphaproteobacteria bacterium]USO02881.1 MAG: hypothetical protein H6853_04850 [Rhodospirillales bacterium]